MTMAQSLLEFILALLRNDDAKAAFAADPQKTLADAGLSGVCHEDVADAMSYIAEYHPVALVGDHGYHTAPTNVPPPAAVERELDPVRPSRRRRRKSLMMPRSARESQSDSSSH
jgi:hypothetical protein